MRAVPLLLVALATLWPGRALAQGSEPFGTSCPTVSGTVRETCLRVAEAARILGSRTALIAAGGNPVPGTASTLGMRLPGRPRVTIAGRVSAGRVTLPGLVAAGAEELEATPVAFGLDVGVGLFSGLTLASTIGGFGSVDLLGSLTRVRVPTSDGLFGSFTSWAAGARVGLLRESFTAPGVSVSAMYRQLGDFGYGTPELADSPAWFRLQNTDGWSVRAAASKRLLGLGFTAGAGRDYYRAGASGRVRNGSAPVLLQDDDLELHRSTLFANASFTYIILHAVGELGWQGGGSSPAGLPDTGRLDDGGLYGSLALRLSL